MRPRLRSLLVFLLLLAAALITYYYGLADVPRRDHTSYLPERAFVQNEWEWFWHSVSWSRTRFVGAGDSYLFRPLHMAVLALKDILFRNNLFASGAINIFFMTVASLSLYRFANKLVRSTLALALALLFMVQHAGLEMVAWGHISPYLLALAFFGFALTSLFEAGPDNKAALKKAGVLLLLGALVHEMVVVALVLAAPFLLFIRWRAGRGAEIGGLPLRSYLLWVIAVPVLVYLGLDLFDYLYRGAPALFGALDNLHSSNRANLFEAMLAIAGASAVAFLAPFKVKLATGDTRLLAWDFESLRLTIAVAGVVLSVAVMSGIVFCIRAMKNGGNSRLAFSSLLALLMFIGIILGLGIGRIYLREMEYFYNTTYYYSITAYIFCLLVAIGIHHAKKSRPPIASKFFTGAFLVALVPLLVFNVTKTRDTLRESWHFRKTIARMHIAIDEALVGHSQRYCLAGTLRGRYGTPYGNIIIELLRGHFCRDGDERTQGYLLPGEEGSLWLAELTEQPFDAFGKPEAPSLERTYEKGFMLSHDSYERPDLALTVRNSLHTIIYFSYENPQNMLAFEMQGPIVQGRKVINGKMSLPIRQSVLPYMHSEQRLELRHGDLVYLFVDGRLVTAMDNFNERTGKIGLYLRGIGNREPSFSDLMVTTSAPAGAEPVSFKPVARLLERSDIAFR